MTRLSRNSDTKKHGLQQQKNCGKRDEFPTHRKGSA